MSIFTRSRKPRVLQPVKRDAAPVLMRFLTHGGARVVVTETRPERFTACCLGCDWTSGGSHGNYLDTARSDANEHASECRAMPKPEVAR